VIKVKRKTTETALVIKVRRECILNYSYYTVLPGSMSWLKFYSIMYFVLP
jgi:hypothetical protein